MEGVNPENNEICLEVMVENLARSLKTIQAAKSVKVKLTKKHCPCLTIAAELVRSGTATVWGCIVKPYELYAAPPSLHVNYGGLCFQT